MSSTQVVSSELPRISSDEFRDRQTRLRARAEERGLAGVFIWSRGATTQDHYADAFYFTNFYSQYPFVADEPGRWRAKGFVGVVIPVAGPVTVLTDLGSYREDLVVADRVETDQDVIRAASHAIKRDVADGKIGLLGGAPLSFRWHRYLEAEVGARFVDVEDLGYLLRLIKSPAEQRLLRAAGRVGALGVEAIMDASVPGATEAEVAAAGYEAVVAAGGMVYGMGISTGPYAHMHSQSQPAPFDPRRTLEAGDMSRVDFYGSVDGYLFDFGRTRVVGRAPDESQQALIDAARDCVTAGVEAIRPGATLGDVAAAADAAFAASDLMRGPGAIPPEFKSYGHSLGLSWEAPFIDLDSSVVIEPGMCLAVERRTARPGAGGATFEDNVLVVNDGYELLSDARRAWDAAD